MSLIDIDYNPDKRKLRQFGIAALIAGIVISLLLYLFKEVSFKWILPVLTAGLIVFILSLFCVKITRLIYVGLTLITMPVGIVVSFIVLSIFYFLLIVPVGLVFRMAGRDPLNRRFEPSAKSYWEKRTHREDIENYFHQF
jgi:hypothetical protein